MIRQQEEENVGVKERFRALITRFDGLEEKFIQAVNAPLFVG